MSPMLNELGMLGRGYPTARSSRYRKKLALSIRSYVDFNLIVLFWNIFPHSRLKNRYKFRTSVFRKGSKSISLWTSFYLNIPVPGLRRKKEGVAPYMSMPPKAGWTGHMGFPWNEAATGSNWQPLCLQSQTGIHRFEFYWRVLRSRASGRSLKKKMIALFSWTTSSLPLASTWTSKVLHSIWPRRFPGNWRTVVPLARDILWWWSWNFPCKSVRGRWMGRSFPRCDLVSIALLRVGKSRANGNWY